VRVEPVRPLDLPLLVAAVAEAGGPDLEVIGRLAGGAVGAGLVRHADGHESVLTWAPAPPPGTSQLFRLDRAAPLLDVARAVGNPVPAYEAVVPLADGGAVVLQERVDGVPVSVTTARLVEHAVELAQRRRGALADDTATAPSPPFLLTSGPGFCHHDTLRTYDDASRALLERVERIGDELGETLDGADLVHFDYTLGNVLVARGDPEHIVAVIDWDGVGRGDVTLDLVTLAFDLSWRSTGLSESVASLARDTSSSAVFAQVWAHMGLRMVDWSIRHHPDTVEWWLGVARRHV
jgi:aminoglycoside phosphotransferase (APT) family kinase protein